MPEYTSQNTLRIAKRFHNRKRTYLLVNPLQAKHIPVQPSRALAMMDALGARLARKYPDAGLVIGFAETATAIGAVVAGHMGPHCVYLHTTRESFPGALHWIEFQEEHSHAVEQKLSDDALSEQLSKTHCVILVDDEISTGATLLNMVAQLRQRHPCLAEKQIVAASILNRVSPEHEARMRQAGVQSEYLVKLPQEDYAALVAPIEIREADPALPRPLSFQRRTLSCPPPGDPRLGLPFSEYRQSCLVMARAFLEQALPHIPAGSRILTLGTEECMYPVLVLGAMLEEMGRDYQVRCHATTRSPIGVCPDPGYPIRSGCRLPSFYDGERTTYLYDLEPCDVLIVISDTPAEGTDALCSLVGAFPPDGVRKVFYLQGGQHVWYL